MIILISALVAMAATGAAVHVAMRRVYRMVKANRGYTAVS